MGCPKLPVEVKGVIWTDLATCFMRQGAFPAAEAALEEAKNATPKYPRMLALSQQLKQRPLAGVDNRVDVSTLKEWEKPFWREEMDEAPPAGKKPGAVKVTTPPGVKKPATPPPGR